MEFLLPFLTLFLAFSSFACGEEYENGDLLVGNGTKSVPFSSSGQCFGGIGRPASGSYRLHFNVVDEGSCDFLICYRSQLHADAIREGFMVDKAYSIEETEMFEKCMALNSSNGPWHGIRVESKSDSSIELKGTLIPSRTISDCEFQLELGNPKDPFTKLLILKDGKFVPDNSQNVNLKEFFKAQKRGASLANSAGLWALGLDLLPSDPMEGAIQLITFSHTGQKQVCTRNGTLLPSEKNCHIEAKFLAPNEPGKPFGNASCRQVNSSEDGQVQLPGKWTVEKPLGNGSSILIRGRLKKGSGEFMQISLLHNWTEPNAILGETILSLKVRKTYLNWHSFYNLTERGRSYADMNKDLIAMGSEFVLKITVLFQGHFSHFLIELNCLKQKEIGYEVPLLPFPSIDHIHIDGTMELLDEPLISYNSTHKEKPYPMSYSFDVSNKWKELIYFIGRFHTSWGVSNHDINLVNYQEDSVATIPYHLSAHFSFKSQYFLWNSYQLNSKGKLNWTETSLIEGIKLGRDKHFLWVYSSSFGKSSMNGILLPIQPDIHFNYVQLRGSIEIVKMSNANNLDNSLSFPKPLRAFNTLVIEFLLLFKMAKEDAIVMEFTCSDENKCKKPTDEAAKKFESKFKFNLNEKFFARDEKVDFYVPYELRIHANSHEYSVHFKRGIGRADYWEMLTPDHFDTFKIASKIGNYHDFRIEAMAIEWEQKATELALPFSYKLEKTLEIGSKISIVLKPEIFFQIALVHQAAFPNHEKFGATVMTLNFFQGSDNKIGVLFATSSTNNGTDDEISQFPSFSISGQNLSIEIEVQKEAYLISFNDYNRQIGKHSYKHILPPWSVDFLAVLGKSDMELFEAKVTWPSDSTTNWLLPSPEHSLQPQNSFAVFPLKQIQLEIELKEGAKQGTVFVLNRCQEWTEEVEKMCNHFIIKFVMKIEMNGQNYHIETGPEFADNQKLKTRTDVTPKTFVLTIELAQTKDLLEIIHFYFHEDKKLEKSFKNHFPIPYTGIEFIQLVGDFESVKVKELVHSPWVTKTDECLTMKLERPLRVGDSIEFGFASAPKTIRFVYGLGNMENTLIASIEFQKDGNWNMLIKNVNKQEETYPIPNTSEQAQIKFKLFIGQSQFQISMTSPIISENVLSIEHDHLYWAIQFIEITPGKDIIEEPKIVHNY